MAEPTEKEPRGPTNLRIKFRSASLEQFIERYSVDVSRGGIFIRTREPLAVGTRLNLEFQLLDAQPLMSGEGTVVWIRESDPARPSVTPGMGVRFDKLTPDGQSTLEKILAEKGRLQQSGASGGSAGGGMAVRRPSSMFAIADLQQAAAQTTPDSVSGAPAAEVPPSSRAPLAPATTTKPGLLASRMAGGAAPGRPRPTAGMPALRQPPVPSAVFEPPTAADIDKALETLHEDAGPTPALPTSGAAPRLAPGAQPGQIPSGATADPTFHHHVADDTSSEPTHAGGATDEQGRAPLPSDRPLSEIVAASSDTVAPAAARPPGPPAAAPAPPAALAPAAALDRTMDEATAPPTAARKPGVPAVPVAAEKSTRFRAASRAYPTLRKRRLAKTVAALAVVAAAAVAAVKLQLKDRLFPPNAGPVASQPVAAPTPGAAAPTPTAAPVETAARPPTTGEPPAATPGAGGAAAAAGEAAPAAPAKKETPKEPSPTAPAAALEPPKPAAPPGEAAGGAPGGAAAKTVAATAPGEPKTPPRHPHHHPAAVAPAAVSSDEPSATASQTEAKDKAPTERGAGTGTGKVATKSTAADKPNPEPSGVDKPSAPSAPTAAPILKITSTPAGAEVIIDGTSVGNTPYVARDVDPSSPHAITLKKDGFETDERMVSGLEWTQPHGNTPQTLKLSVKLRRTAPPEPPPSAGPKESGAAPEDTGGPYIKEVKPGSP